MAQNYEETRKLVSEHLQHLNFIDIDGVEYSEEETCTKVIVPFHVQLPSRMRVGGVSKFGVRSVEKVEFEFDDDWKKSRPRIFFRDDFPQNFPHLEIKNGRPHPCIYPGSNLSDLIHGPQGLYGLFYRVKDWLDRASRNGLYDFERGWESRQAGDSKHIVWLDSSWLAELLDTSSFLECTVGYRQLESGGAPASATIWSQQTPLKKAEILPPGELSRTHCYVIRVPGNTTTEDRDFYSCTSLEEVFEKLKKFDCKKPISGVLRRLIPTYDDLIKARPLNILIVLGVKRPARIEGTTYQYEYIFYWLTYQSSKAVAAGVRASVAWPREMLTPRFCERISGKPIPEPLQKLTMIGAGSLGSKIFSHLIRGGARDITLIDQANFARHNSIRHVLTPDPGGKTESKVKLLKDSFSEFSRLVITDIPDSIENVMERSELFNDRIIIETTASHAVREYLVDTAFNQASLIASASIRASGSSGSLYVEGADRSPRLDDLWRYSHYQLSKLNNPQKYCVPNMPEVIGQGCASLTMRVSDIDASLIAAAITNRLLSALNDGFQGFSAIVENREDGSLEWHIDQVAEIVALNTVNWEIRIPRNVIETMAERMRLATPIETGGPLYGEFDLVHKRIYVFEAGDPPPDSTATNYSFTMGTIGIGERTTLLRSTTCGHVVFLGSWHTHPAGGDHSGTDKQSLRDLRKKQEGAPFLMLVVAPGSIHALTSDDI